VLYRSFYSLPSGAWKALWTGEGIGKGVEGLERERERERFYQFPFLHSVTLLYPKFLYCVAKQASLLIPEVTNYHFPNYHVSRILKKIATSVLVDKDFFKKGFALEHHRDPMSKYISTTTLMDQRESKTLVSYKIVQPQQHVCG
jgi:hypothetical protein